MIGHVKQLETEPRDLIENLALFEFNLNISLSIAIVFVFFLDFRAMTTWLFW